LKKEEASGACRDPQHHNWKWGQSPPVSAESTHGQLQSQRASKLGRLVWAGQQAPSTWGWVHASAHKLYSHGRTSCCLHPATCVPPGRGDVCGCLGQVRHPASDKWVAQAHSHGFRPAWTLCLTRQPTGACLATSPGFWATSQMAPL